MSGDLLASEQTNLLDSKTAWGVGDEVFQDRSHQQGMFGQLSKSGEMGIEDHFASTFNECQIEISRNGGTWKVPIHIRRTVQDSGHRCFSKVARVVVTNKIEINKIVSACKMLGRPGQALSQPIDTWTNENTKMLDRAGAYQSYFSKEYNVNTPSGPETWLQNQLNGLR